MISMSNLGVTKILGRLGNSMFQYAFLRSKANELKCKYSCPHWWGDDIFNLKETNRIISPVPNKKIIDLRGEPGGYTIREKEVLPGMEILGFFQSWKYFKREDVLKWFDFKPEVQKVRSSFAVSSRVAVHVRRGDYLNFKNVYNILEFDYYSQCLMDLACRRIALFSDDFSSAIRMMKRSNYCIVSVTGNSPAKDLFLMSKECNGVVMANSSFSWWGAYLNPHQNRIFYPKKWFVSKKNPDIAPEGWHGI